MDVEQLISLIQVFFASILFGTVFVPIKRYGPGDGFFAQFIMCLSIFFVGFANFAYNNFDGFYPLAMLGGASWCFGNLMAIPIINELGLSISMLLFSINNCLTNFFVGTFGLFGLKARPAEKLWLNVIGMYLILIGGAMISFVKNKQPQLKETNSAPSIESYLSTSTINDSSAKLPMPETNERQKKVRRIIAIIFALVSGILYGLIQVPIIAIQDHPEIFNNAPKHGSPYIYSHFTGILIVSTAALVIYSIFKKNSPSINPQIVLPSLLAGLMFGVAMTITIVCTEKLSQAITGPITAMVPGLVATIWSVFYFKEIETGRNLILLWTAITISVIGAICIGMSKM